jgi:hypothetical protein
MLYCSKSVIPAKWAGADFLWVAQYGPAEAPEVQRWDIWQSTDGYAGAEPHGLEGIGDHIDVDRLHGGWAKLDRMRAT